MSGLSQLKDVSEADDLTGVISFSEDWAKLSAPVEDTDDLCVRRAEGNG